MEESRRHWLAEVGVYAPKRQVAKARGRRSPRPSDPNPFWHPTGWFGPLRSAASLHALAAQRGRLSDREALDRNVDALAAACLAAGGGLTSEQKAALASVTAELGRRVRAAAARGDTRAHFRALTACGVVDLVAAAAAPEGPPQENPRHDADTDAAWEVELAAAQSEDERRRDRARSWVPPIMSALVAAAMNSRLRRLFPSPATTCFGFSRSPDVGCRMQCWLSVSRRRSPGVQDAGVVRLVE